MQKKCENLFAHYGNVINERNLQCIAFFRPQIAIFKMVRHTVGELKDLTLHRTIVVKLPLLRAM